MFGIHKLFNRKSHPTYISTLTEKVNGHTVDNICRQRITRWSSLSYKCQLYAKRNDDLTYDVFLAYRHDDMDYGKRMVRCSISLQETLKILKERDDAETNRRLSSFVAEDHEAYAKRFIDPDRKSHNIRHVLKRLQENNPPKH